jgi:hypothetical protein
MSIDSTGKISTTTATPAGTYTLMIYGVDDYTTTTFVLTVLAAPAAAQVDICCIETVSAANPQTGVYDDSTITNNKANRTVGLNTDIFYAGIAAGTRGAYPQPLFRSYSEYIQYLQGKTR